MDWKYDEIILDNGFKVNYKHTNSETIYASLMVNQGSLHEKRGEEGLAHFLEHCLVVGGTLKYDPTSSKEKFANLINSNAQTRLNNTELFADIEKEDLIQFLEISSQMFYHPRFDSEAVDNEKKNVLREISDDKSYFFFNDKTKYRELIFKNQGGNKNILGDEDIIKNSSIEDLINFHSRGFTALNSELCITGSIPDNFEMLVEKYFGNVATGKNIEYVFPKLDKFFGNHFIHSKSNDINPDNPSESSANVLLTSRVPNYLENDWISVSLMSQIFCEGEMNSKLFKKLRDEKNLCYYVMGIYEGKDNLGHLGISTKIPAIKIEESINTIFEAYEEMKEGDFSENDIELAKKNSRYMFKKLFETNKGRYNIRKFVKSTGISPAVYLNKLNALTKDDVVEAANLYLPKDRENGEYVIWVQDPLKKE